MSADTELNYIDINRISLSITKFIESETSGNINDMYAVFQHAFAIFLVGTCNDKKHLLEGVELIKKLSLHYYAEHQDIVNGKTLNND